jgi:cell division protease FtsH
MGPTLDYSEQTARDIDKVVKELVNTNYELAVQILKENRDALDRLAEGLIVWETLDFSQVEKLVKGEDIGMPIIEKKKKVEERPVVAEEESISPKVDPGDDPALA